VIRAVLLDALGTLLELEPPAPALVAALAQRGIAVDEAQARAALAVEMRHYRAHCIEAADPDRLAALRADCTEVLRAQLPSHARGLDAAELQDALLRSLRFAVYPEVVGELLALRDAGATLIVVSNWDISLHGVLEQTGLTALLHGVVTSAQAGVAKPDPAIFARALALAGATAGEALHAGDDVELDVGGARAAGVRAVLIARGPGDVPAVPADVVVLRSLAGLHAITS
jgi:putative hydrolase of the HAD superfamily